jgi:selenide,water dikinase
VLHGTGSTLLSVDGFRAMIDDPYLLGRICAHHSLNDLFAMGAQPSAALALATIPLMAEAMMEEDLFQLLSGVVDVLNAHGAPLVGGHSAEGAELSIGLTVTGVPGARTLTKSMCRPGDALIVTKPLGTGVILAAAMRGLHQADAIPACLEAMNCSNAPALEILQGYGVSALTDVTGFGLIGHLSEMLRASDCGVELRLDRVPMLPGARSFANQGVRSSIQSANALALGDFSVAPGVTDGAALALLSDPQTSGGLLACVSSEQADACVSTLGDAGIPAANIGHITPKEQRNII